MKVETYYYLCGTNDKVVKSDMVKITIEGRHNVVPKILGIIKQGMKEGIDYCERTPK